ncbi:nuclear receptor coactivator 1-like [Camarhynchus parvulus]|uniref:nuclear receptor coactivator 1-like n=1 Tax=Geospiza parvula TaxID=87175 RepID=UPI001238266D|nr:nuclear receptor coactivator 1-like [Camarhynchus parvulus]
MFSQPFPPSSSSSSPSSSSSSSAFPAMLRPKGPFGAVPVAAPPPPPPPPPPAAAAAAARGTFQNSAGAAALGMARPGLGRPPSAPNQLRLQLQQRLQGQQQLLQQNRQAALLGHFGPPVGLSLRAGIPQQQQPQPQFSAELEQLDQLLPSLEKAGISATRAPGAPEPPPGLPELDLAVPDPAWPFGALPWPNLGKSDGSE